MILMTSGLQERVRLRAVSCSFQPAGLRGEGSPPGLNPAHRSGRRATSRAPCNTRFLPEVVKVPDRLHAGMQVDDQ